MANLNKVIEYYIHRPVTTAGDVLYKRLDSGVGEVDRKVNDEALYTEEIKKKYNSPDNIRRVLMTESRVVTQYFRPVVGAETLGTIRDNKIENMFAKDNEVEIRRKVFASSHYTGYAGMAKLAQQKGIKLETVQGSGLKALVRPWVAQNVEEIYFDWLYLTGIYNGNNTLETFGTSININERNNTLAKFICDALEVNDIGELRERFPRLRAVACILNLDSMLDRFVDVMREDKDALDGEVLISTLKSSDLILWGYFSVYGNTMSYKYSCKDGVYTYDAEILKGYFESKIAERREKIGIDQRDEAESKDLFDSEEVKDIERVKDVYGAGVVNNLVKAVYMNKRDKSEQDELIINKYTKKG